jgi:hypothetical protein
MIDRGWSAMKGKIDVEGLMVCKSVLGKEEIVDSRG